MTANSINRDDPRNALVALAEAAMVGVGLPVKSIVGFYLDWQAATVDANMQTPYVCIADSGTASQTHGIGNEKWHNVFVYEWIATFREVDVANGRTEGILQSEMSLVDKYLRDLIANNRKNPTAWDFIDFSPDFSSMSEKSEILYSPAKGCRQEKRDIYVQVTER